MAQLIHGLDAARVRANLERVREQIAGTGRDPAEVELLAAVKYVPLEEMRVLGEDVELLEGDVLDGGEDLDAARVAPGAGDLLAHALEVRAHDARVETPDQLRHATPA